MTRLLLIALAALATAGADQPPSGDGHVYVRPTWSKKPDDAAMERAYPKLALTYSMAGRAVMVCDAEVDGGVDHCQVVEESPSGMGFGAAVLKLAPEIRMNPGTVDGRPYVGQVGIPFNFSVKGFANNSRHHGGPTLHNVYISLPWAAAPTRAEVDAARPRDLSSGAATLLCAFARDRVLGECTVVSEDPGGHGLGAAAIALSRKFRAPDLGGKPAVRDQVSLAIHFDPAPAAGTPDLVRDPLWVRLADQDVLDAAFPAAARVELIRKGTSVVDCLVLAHGELGDCRLESESPAGKGFGQAGLKMASLYAIGAWSADGRPVDGRRVRFEIEQSNPLTR